jgi:hypothetical protein
VLSTWQKYIDINDAIVQRAEQDVPASGYDTSAIYTESIDPITGGPADPSNSSATSPVKVTGYLTSDGLPPNGAPVSAGLSFPPAPTQGQFYLRLDYTPNRLFRYDGRRWVKVEDALRTNLTPGPTNTTQRSSFINDTNKFMSNSIAWDCIRVTSVYVPAANAATLSFTYRSNAPSSVVTKIRYNSTYGVRTLANGISITNTISNTSGNISFTVSNVSISSSLEYNIYQHVINERQSLSQALRPSADNL